MCHRKISDYSYGMQHETCNIVTAANASVRAFLVNSETGALKPQKGRNIRNKHGDIAPIYIQPATPIHVYQGTQTRTNSERRSIFYRREQDSVLPTREQL